MLTEEQIAEYADHISELITDMAAHPDKYPSAEHVAAHLILDPALAEENDKVFVEGLNIIKRHERARSTGDMATSSPGGIVEKEGPINVSNVMLLDPKGNKGTRIGVRRTDDGKRVRIARRSGAEVD